MRDYLFRGQAMCDCDDEGFELIEKGQWVYGSLIQSEGYAYIMRPEERLERMIEVMPETVGQFTELIDEGVKIFEGDIIRCRIEGMKSHKELRIVVWEQTGFYTRIITSEYPDGLSPGSWSLYEIQAYRNKVIGDKTDNFFPLPKI